MDLQKRGKGGVLVRNPCFGAEKEGGADAALLRLSKKPLAFLDSL